MLCRKHPGSQALGGTGQKGQHLQHLCTNQPQLWYSVQNSTEDLGLVWKAAKLVPKLLNNRERNLHLALCELWKRHVELDPGFLKRVATVDESWVYMYEPEMNQQSTQWISKGGVRPIKFKRMCTTGKVLIITFFDWKGLIHREFLRGQTVNRYNFIWMLHRMRPAIATKCPRILRNFHLHMHNARMHTTHLTKLFIHVMNISVMPHPPPTRPI